MNELHKLEARLVEIKSLLLNADETMSNEEYGRLELEIDEIRRELASYETSFEEEPLLVGRAAQVMKESGHGK